MRRPETSTSTTTSSTNGSISPQSAPARRWPDRSATAAPAQAAARRFARRSRSGRRARYSSSSGSGSSDAATVTSSPRSCSTAVAVGGDVEAHQRAISACPCGRRRWSSGRPPAAACPGRAAPRRRTRQMRKPSRPCGLADGADHDPPGRQGVRQRSRHARAGPRARAGLDHRAQRAGDPPCLPITLPTSSWAHVQLEHELPILTLAPLDAHLVGMVDQLAGEVGRAVRSIGSGAGDARRS